MKKIVTALAFMVALTPAVAFAEPVQADRPTLTLTADTTNVGDFVIEAGISYARQETFAFPITLKTGITDWMEVRIGSNVFTVSTDGDVNGSPVALGVKFQFLDIDHLALGLYSAARINYDGDVDVNARALFNVSATEWLTIPINIGTDIVTADVDRSHVLFAGGPNVRIIESFGEAGPVNVFAEVSYAVLVSGDKGAGVAGATYAPADNAIIEFSNGDL